MSRLDVLHESHQGLEKTWRTDREIMYWLGICHDISERIDRYLTCLKFMCNNSKEPLILHDVSTGPYLHVAMDIMKIGGHDSLFAVACYSKYPELAWLEYKTEFVIAHVKGISVRHGIPQLIYADNQQFNSRTFLNFVREWGIAVTTLSPGYPQSKGQVEWYVRIIKQLKRKTEYSGKDLYITLLQ